MSHLKQFLDFYTIITLIIAYDNITSGSEKVSAMKYFLTKYVSFEIDISLKSDLTIVFLEKNIELKA